MAPPKKKLRNPTIKIVKGPQRTSWQVQRQGEGYQQGPPYGVPKQDKVPEAATAGQGGVQNWGSLVMEEHRSFWCLVQASIRDTECGGEVVEPAFPDGLEKYELELNAGTMVRSLFQPAEGEDLMDYCNLAEVPRDASSDQRYDALDKVALRVLWLLILFETLAAL